MEFVTTQCRFVLWKDNAYFKKIGKHLTAGMAEAGEGGGASS